jgi:hypothetical protein
MLKFTVFINYGQDVFKVIDFRTRKILFAFEIPSTYINGIDPGHPSFNRALQQFAVEIH